MTYIAGTGIEVLVPRHSAGLVVETTPRACRNRTGIFVQEVAEMECASNSPHAELVSHSPGTVRTPSSAGLRNLQRNPHLI